VGSPAEALTVTPPVPPPPYATVDDLRERFEGTIPDSSTVMLESKIGQAERLITATLRADIGDWILAGRTTAADVQDVVCDMVLRPVRNPGGVIAQAAGPYSQTFDSAVASGQLWLTRENRLQLGLRRFRSGSAEMVDDALPYVLSPPRTVELSNARQPGDWD
jgi:Phage protein Gp19/Gp15/Gp42